MRRRNGRVHRPDGDADETHARRTQRTFKIPHEGLHHSVALRRFRQIRYSTAPESGREKRGRRRGNFRRGSQSDGRGACARQKNRRQRPLSRRSAHFPFGTEKDFRQNSRHKRHAARKFAFLRRARRGALQTGKIEQNFGNNQSIREIFVA